MCCQQKRCYLPIPEGEGELAVPRECTLQTRKESGLTADLTGGCKGRPVLARAGPDPDWSPP